MSSGNKQLPKGDPSSSKFKAEEVNEDEDMEQEEKKPRHKEHHGQKHKQKAKRGKESNDEESKKDLGSVDDSGEIGSDDADDDDDDDDEDDYGEESQGSFIAPDDEVEKELMEERERKAQEDLDKRGRKKKKGKALKKLDDDDFDLIQQNTGITIQRKRLKKNIDQEREEETDIAVKKEEYPSQDEEEEQINTRERIPQASSKIYKEPYQRQQVREPIHDIDPDRIQVAQNIFNDNRDIRNEIQARQKKQDDMNVKGEAIGIESMFDGDEIDDQLATRQDKQIADLDYPERLQLKLGERFGPSGEEIQEEADWIFDRLQQDGKRDLAYNGAAIKKKICEVIHLFRNNFLDIPMIIKYRRYIYAKELDEADVQTIFNLDQEYGQFKMQKDQILQFIKKIIAFNPDSRVYEDELHFAKNQHDLNDFSTLVSFLKNFYHEELQTLPEEQKKKIPVRQDKIQSARKQKLDDFVRRCMLRPEFFTENLQHNKLIHKPPEPQDMLPFHLTQKYMNEQNSEEMKVLSGACEFASAELAAQPYIRKNFKEHFYEFGTITTTPTDKGMKDLDIFHPSYRVKRITKEPIVNFHPWFRKVRKSEERDDELFLDIIQNERNGMINLVIDIDQELANKFYSKIEPFYLPLEDSPQWNIMRKEVLRRMVDKVLIPDIVKEIKGELQEISENFVIKKCQEKYKQMIMTGPFDCQEGGRKQQHDSGRMLSKSKQNRYDEEIIKDRPRYNVMGVILQQIDNNTSVVTVAVVDKYGELVAHKDLMHLIPPRKLPPQKMGGTEEDEQRQKKLQLSLQEEQKEHDKDKDKIKDLMEKHQVDLIVVGANKLEARRIQEVLKGIAENMKNFGGSGDSDDEKDGRKSKKRNADYTDEPRKEAFVIWGSLEVPKLFASSHQSQKLLKNCQLLVKQAVSLARFEQDPMCEMLNLWSSISSENSTLSLGLHSLQKLVNQSKLADALEEINVSCVNEVGVDLNVVVDHDHMHCLLQFISGLGPRKAKKLIQKLKQLGRKVFARSEFLNNITLGKNVFISAIAFLKIKVPPEELEKNQGLDLLDQTRIHLESYTMAVKVACDVVSQNIEQLSDFLKYTAVKEVIQNPGKLSTLDIKQYEEELKIAGQANMTSILDLIIEELQHPFKDPREYRTPSKVSITNKDLFYMLIDESERTFKVGIIVTATITRVENGKNVLCKLDNGLDGMIHKEEICNNNEKLEDVLQSGQVITGRISKITNEDEKKFGVNLICKRVDLERHDKFVDQNTKYNDEDLINQNFKIENREKAQSRYQSRRINHPKFKNISSVKAKDELLAKENGDFVFRPSSKGPDNLTLTWKFYTDNIVHIDIQETEKPTGASIGNKLHISDEIFDNLQEIVERYIIPCNRALREVTGHAKFLRCSNEEELSAELKKERAEDANRIPYKFCVLNSYPQYVVLGYIAKGDRIDKEYIKIKPRGYYFHDRYHNPFQHLINWFKENFRTKDYLKLKKRYDSRPPILAKASGDPQRRSIEPQKRESQMDWEPATNMGKSGGNSVHSVNEDRYGGIGETPLVKSEYNQPGKSTNSEIGGQSRWGANTGAQFSEYNQSNQMQMSDNAQKPRGVCYNCQQEGHMSRECPTKKQSSYGRGGNRGGRDRDDTREQSKPQENEPTSWGQKEDQNYQQAPSKSPTWGGDAAMKSESKSPIKKSPGYEGGWGGQEQPVAGGWGQKTPIRSENFNQTASWGGKAGDNDNWNNNQGGDDDTGRRDSPTRSQRSYGGDDQRGRGGFGRGRGRGTGGPSGGGGGSRECFKCHQEGHMARECPNASSNDDRGRGRGRGGGGRDCFICHQEGHMARECPNQDSSDRGRGRGRGRGRDGDNQGGGGGGGPRTCFKCGQEGHFARECPNPSENTGERPYKRQRRDEDGGSVRRQNDDGGNDWNNNSRNNNNNDGGNAGWSSNAQDSSSQAWGAAGGDWNKAQPPTQQQEPTAWGADQPKKEEEGGWNNNNKPEGGSGW